MTSRSLVLAVSMTVAFGIAAPAQALSLNVEAGVDAEVGVGAGGGDEASDAGGEATAEAGGEAGLQLGVGGRYADYGAAATITNGAADARVDMVIGLIAESQWQGDEFQGAVNVDGAQAFSVAAWLRDETEARFRAAVQAAMDQIQNLQTAIAANASMSAWLQAQNIDLSTVVAVGVDAEGQLVAFTQ